MDVRLLGIAILCSLGLLSFLLIAKLVAGGHYADLEGQILLSLRQPDNPAELIGPRWLHKAAVDVTALGGATVLTLITLLVCTYLAIARRFRTVLFVLAATISGMVISFGLKNVFERARPDAVPHITEVSTYSFPSGHSLIPAVVYLTLGTLLAQATDRHREKIFFIATALLLVGIIGVTRVYLGVHYPTDVLAGWSLGIAWALFCEGVAYLLRRRGTLGRPRKLAAEN
ncbi:MAG: PAP2 family protein [Puniceicoccaceae bacterium 5H]|nr:MAG: PAP2 family protein [Puniceicoccaceae bacterium 5H]